MTEKFIGKMKPGKKNDGNASGKLRPLSEGECVFEAVAVGSNKIKCVLSNSEDVGIGDQLIMSQISPPMPSPRFEAYKHLKA